MINQIGYRTDCWIRGLEGSVEDRGAYYVVRAARNPGFYWGNFLLFKQAPTRSDYKEWQAVFAREFDDTFNHVAFGWDSPDHGEIEDFVNNGFDLDTAVAYDMVECPSPVEALPDIQIRPIESESDWQCVIRLQIDSSRPAGTQETFELFKRRLVEAYRVCCQQG